MMGCYVGRTAPECCQERRATDANKTSQHASPGTKSRHGAGPIVEPSIIHQDPPLVSVAKAGEIALISAQLNRSPSQPSLD
jgi:hypothetical protein